MREIIQNRGKNFLSLLLISVLLISNVSFINNPKVLAEENSNQNELPTLEKEEIHSLRTETSKTYLNSDGTYTTEISQSPIHFKNDKDQWVSINNELIHNDEENTYENKANDFIVKFNEKQESNEPIIEIEDDNYIANMELEPLDHTGEQPAAVEGIVKGDSISYSDVYKDVDLKYTIGSDRIKEDIIYKSKPENGFPTSFTYKMDLEGLKVKKQNGVIYLYDPSTNENIYHFESPYMYDSFKPEGYKSIEGIKSIPEEAISYDVNLTYEVVENNLFLHLNPNQDWLNDSQRVYPLTIDPTIVKIQSSAYVEDTNLRSGFPTQTGGNDLELGGGASNGNVIRSILKFDLSSIPTNTNIVSSSLNLWFSSTNNASPISISLFKVSRDWYENEASWNYAKINPSTSWTNSGGDYVVSNKLSTVSDLTSPVNLDTDLKKWNVPTHIVYNWRNNLDPNFGLIIKSDSESTNFYKKFISSENSVDDKYKPLLEVTYEDPTASNLNQIAEGYGFTPSDPTVVPDEEMVFNTVEEFEQFLKEEEANANLALNNEVIDLTGPEYSIAASGTTTKTYSYQDKALSHKITSYARVTRYSTTKKVKDVTIWSEQTGLVFGITWDEKTTWHTLNGTQTGGKAYVRGIKTYGMSVVGQSLGYNKSVTYTVPF